VKRAALALGIVAVALLVFAAWGTRTAAGRRAFDEMAGMIPYGAGALGVVALAVAGVLWLIGGRRS
jgi:hypothetical protein